MCIFVTPIHIHRFGTQLVQNEIHIASPSYIFNIPKYHGSTMATKPWLDAKCHLQPFCQNIGGWGWVSGRVSLKKSLKYHSNNSMGD